VLRGALDVEQGHRPDASDPRDRVQDPPNMADRKRSQQRVYDVDDLVTLMIGDIEVELRPYHISEELRAKLTYWMGRAWDSGWAAVVLNGDKKV